MSTPTVTPVATGTTGVFDSLPVIRFQQAVDVQLAVADLERRVRRLARQLDPSSLAGPRFGGRRIRSAWWPTDLAS